MPCEFFGQYDLLGNPRYEDIHGRISIRSTKYIGHQLNLVDDSVDLLFHGLDGINELICQLTRLRDDMVDKAMARCQTCQVQAKVSASAEPAVCRWYLDNVVCGDKSTKSCPNYKPVKGE